MNLKCHPSFIRRRGSSLSWLPGAVIWWREVIWTTTSTGSKANSVHRYVHPNVVHKISCDVSKSVFLNNWFTEVVSVAFISDFKTSACGTDINVTMWRVIFFVILQCFFFTINCMFCLFYVTNKRPLQYSTVQYS